MISTISKHEFQDAFRSMDRQDQFSYEGQLALFEYLEQYEEDTGEQVELDVIALCCEYTEHESALNCVNEYGLEFEIDPEQDEDETEEAARDFLRYHTQVIEFNTGIIIQDF